VVTALEFYASFITPDKVVKNVPVDSDDEEDKNEEEKFDILG
jgi:hypothetical protein